VQDPAGQFGNPYLAMGNNPVSMTDPDGQWVNFVVGALLGGYSGYKIAQSQGLKGGDMWSMILGGAVVGTITAGIGTAVTASSAAALGSFGSAVAGGAVAGFAGGGAFSQMGGGSFIDGAWKGAATGILGAGLGSIGVGESFGANLALGIGEGAATGAFGAALSGGNIGQGALIGAAVGGILTTASSPQLKNAVNGKGFVNNNTVLQGFVANGDYDGALDYFGMEGSFDPSYTKGNPGASAATDRIGKIYYNESAFTSYHKLLAVNQHEMFHSQSMKSGKYNKYKLSENFSYEDVGSEEFGAYMKNYKNQGLYRNSGLDIKGSLIYNGTQSGMYGNNGFFQARDWHMLYRIPRRY
jgi:hypothetical protein